MRRILAGLAVVGLLAVASPAQAVDFSHEYYVGDLGETPVEVGATDVITTTHAGHLAIQLGGYPSPGVHLFVDGPQNRWDCDATAISEVNSATAFCDWPNAPRGTWRVYINTVDVTAGDDVSLGSWTILQGDYLTVTPRP
jgi:subtilisin-like proprotein convertase family protein